MVTGRRLSDLLAFGIALIAVTYGLFLLVIGPETSFMTPDGAAGTSRSPSLVGLLPLGIGLLACWAAVRHRTVGLWAAGVLAAALSVVFLFSYSLQFAVLAALLLVAAALSEVFAARQA